MRRSLIILILPFLFIQCEEKEQAESVIYGQIHTMDALRSVVGGIAVKNDKIIARGTKEDLNLLIGKKTQILDYGNLPIFPGFIEGHGHFSGLGISQIELNLLSTTSWEQVVKLTAAAADSPAGTWIIGRGWHQDKWDSIPHPQFEQYPYHESLSSLTPDHPVILIHASGHSLFANQKAMNEVGMSAESSDPMGGRIVRDINGRLVGVFEETAMRPFNNAYNNWESELSEEDRSQKLSRTIEEAQAACLRNGVTSFQDAGSSYELIQTYKQWADDDKLKVRLWVMLRDSFGAMNPVIDEFPIYDDNNFFTSRAVKSELDGALGSYGAWLLKPYFDKPGFVGQNTTPIKELTRIADMCRDNRLQLCVHAIGDRANRLVLDMMEAKTNDLQGEHRWRIEHAQHLHPDDIPRFADLGIIASMQSVHCTSDAPFVVKRLGVQRAKDGAYVWRSLLDQGAIVSNGTDTPVERISPIENFYAAVTRKPMKMDSAFFKEQVLSREEALHSMTVAAAYAGFEEDIKGSLESGKLADMVVLSKNILTTPDDQILQTEVLHTIVGGQEVYTKH